LIGLLRGKFSTGSIKYFECFQDISFDVRPGEFVGIMGKNGVGKSTLLKIISGIYKPSSGQVVTRKKIAPLIELGAGFNGELSGFENIFLNAAILGFGRAEVLAALPEIIHFSELGEKIHMPVKNYSSGMLVRLGFSIATHLSAEILLIDEVLAVGDVEFQQKCVSKILDLNKNHGRTVILITHDPNAVRDHCSRCLVIGNRTLLYDGSVKEGVNLYLS
jgi:lipopolysaccharide transport system ATP-binding protein